MIFSKRGFYCALSGAFFLVALSASAATIKPEAQKNDNIANPELTSLDTRLQQFSAHFYTALIRVDRFPKAETIGALAQTVERYREQKQAVSATATVINNLGLVEQNADTTPIIGIYRLLLETNEWNTATQLYKKIAKQGDKSLVSNVSLSTARYYFDRDRWKETITLTESIRSDLAAEDYAHALLMYGISLQRLQKHRLALVQYAKIPATSRYYAAARLNMAVADIRQDWWTDAYIAINELLNDKRRNDDTALTDRLYTVLGYSLLQQQYFRNSRDAFRNVSLDGKYTNKALLGIALTAAYQEDYIGALNAVKILKEKKNSDLPVDEATLLIPYFYERIKQSATASAGYDEAIKYYENRIRNVKRPMPSDADFVRKQLANTDAGSITINDEIVDLSEKLPKFVFNNVRILAQYRPYVDRIGDAALAREYDAVNVLYDNVLRKTAQLILDERAGFLTHYMNQSRYGLARMQDDDTLAPQ